jgi:SP family general alpha glucoside:H+ symporter-like MFS transporter
MSDITPQDEKHATLSHLENAEATKDVNNFKADAIEAEQAEQAMTVTQAVKAYPMACLWAFIMSSTIVSAGNVRR